MDWKEELILQFRDLKIDKNIIYQSIQKTVDEIELYCKKYGSNRQIVTDGKTFIEVQNYMRVNVELLKNEDVVSFYLDYLGYKTKEELKVRIDLTVNNEYFNIVYINSDKKPAVKYFIDAKVIDEIFKDLIELNNK